MSDIKKLSKYSADAIRIAANNVANDEDVKTLYRISKLMLNKIKQGEQQSEEKDTKTEKKKKANVKEEVAVIRRIQRV